MKTLRIIDIFHRCVSGLLMKLFNFANMRCTITRVVSRVLLYKRFGPLMETQRDAHFGAHRRMVVGLGNPGMDATRHSVGMAVLGALAARLELAHCWHVDKQVSAVKYGVRAEDILLVHDELDKALGKTAFKNGGSTRGHNGVRSCVDTLQSNVMLRLRVGIGRPEGKTLVERHVLGCFSRSEEPLVAAVLQRSVDLLLAWLAPTHQRSRAHQQGGDKPREPAKFPKPLH
ncbi:probable peptidyl-tRNA hydrolase isoform X4 [Gadus macrocephalus]|uniref:probable peptidyl-tRNA hydrolase isoform X4 n=1 Tax=Gadus macrocephalus TaxID=80720 RepID=UPI0028CBB5B3|nr:probable peptidyl-tRNA hydrolase isoform X4 [Gadus macrocephalus]